MKYFGFFFLLTIGVFNFFIIRVDFPSSGLWTGIRPLETKIKLLDEYCKDGPIDYLIVGSSIADYGFSAKEFSAQMSKNLNRNIKAFNFSSGGAEITFVRKLINFASLNCEFKNVMILFPLQGKQESEFNVGYPDPILRDSPVGSFVDSRFFLKVSKSIFFESFLNLSSLVRDLLIYNTYKSLVGGYSDTVNMNTNGDLESYTQFTNKEEMLAVFKDWSEEMKAVPMPKDEKSIQMSSLHIKNMEKILDFANQKGVKVIFVPTDRYVGIIDRDEELKEKKRKLNEAVAKYFQVDLVNILNKFNPDGFDFADSVHLNHHGSIKFTKLLANTMSNKPNNIQQSSIMTFEQKLDFLDKYNEKYGYEGRHVTKVLKLKEFSKENKLKCFFMKNQFNPQLPSDIEISLVSEENQQVLVNAKQLEDGGYLGDLRFDSDKEKYFFVEIKYNGLLTNAQIRSCNLLQN